MSEQIGWLAFAAYLLRLRFFEASRNRQPENLDDFPAYLAPALLRYRTTSIAKIGFTDQDELMTTDGGFPVQPVTFVQHDFVAFRRPRDRPTRGGKKHIDLLDVRILCYLVRRKNDSWMVSLAERITENVPLFHTGLFGSQRRDDAGFNEALIEAAILTVELEIAGRSHRNRFDVRDRLKNETLVSAKDVNCFAFARLICQAAEVRFGCAQTVRIRGRVSAAQPSSSRGTCCNFHRLTIAYG